MRILTPQIAFHAQEGGKNDRILSVDYHPEFNLMVTGGADNEIKVWSIDVHKEKDGDCPLNFITSLTGHTKSINSVRFSPDGKLLASASDDGYICIWKPKPEREGKWTWNKIKDESQLSRLTLRGHASDVYDLSWGKDSAHLLSGAVDSSVFVWNVEKAGTKAGSMVQSFRDHHHFVQGVAWDPYMNYFVTESSDRSCKVYKAKAITKIPKSKLSQKNATETSPTSSKTVNTTKASLSGEGQKISPDKQAEKQVVNMSQRKKTFKLQGTLEKRLYSSNALEEVTTGQNIKAQKPNNETTGKPNNETTGKKEGDSQSGGNNVPSKPKQPSRHSCIMDDSLPSFFRRLTFSPDGTLLLVPAGLYKKEPKAKVQPTVYIYIRGVWNSPSAHLPGLRNPAIGVRFSPVIYKLCTVRAADDSLIPSPVPWVSVTYRMVFAVITIDGVLVYDTQHEHPIAIAEGLHYAQLTDLSWSSDGQVLVISSSDGYCSILSFENGELGEVLPTDQAPTITKPYSPSDSAMVELLSTSTIPEHILQASETKSLSVGSPAIIPESPPIEEKCPTDNKKVSEKKKSVRRIQPLQIKQIPTVAQAETATKNKESHISDKTTKEKESGPRRIQPTLLTSIAPPQVQKASASQEEEKGQEQTKPQVKKRRIEPINLSSSTS